MGKTFALVFIPAWLCSAIYIVLRPRFTRLLEERHPDIHSALGCPPVGYHRVYTTAESSAILAEIGYILKGDFRQVNDSELNRLGHILRATFLLGLILMAVLSGFVFYDIAISRSC